MIIKSIQGTTLRDFVKDLALRGEATAIQAVAGEELESLTYAELSEKAQRLARGLYLRGLQPGEAVVLFGPIRSTGSWCDWRWRPWSGGRPG